jgi:hypothetical protein
MLPLHFLGFLLDNPNFQSSPSFDSSLSFILMILMTLGTHHEVLFYLLYGVNLTARQKKNLILASLQMRVFLNLTEGTNCDSKQNRFLLVRTCKRRIRRSNTLLRQNFSYFNMRACNKMLEISKFGYKYYKHGRMISYYIGMKIPSLEILRNVMEDLPVSKFSKYLRMNKDSLQRLKVATLLLQMATLLRENHVIQCSPEKLFRTWKKVVYIGDSNKNPNDGEHYLFRDRHDIIFLLVIFISLNADLFDKLTEFVETDMDSCDPIPIDSGIIDQMRKILYTECRNAEGLDKLVIYLQEPKPRQRDLCGFIEIFPILQYGNFWDKSFHYVLSAKDSSRILVNEISLDSENVFNRFHQCFCLFLENLPQNLE